MNAGATGSIWLLPSLGSLLAEPSGALGQSSWWRHAPFARWLVTNVTPRRAAGEGEAFRALQELATRAGLTTEWSGAAGTDPVDLLVLDGRWGQEEARAVMARWKPLLAAGAAVLIHGTNPGEGGSLLWRDWLQGPPPLPHFEFADGAGLGMLLCDEARAPAILGRLCALPREAAADFKVLCAALGARWTASQQAAVAATEAAESRRSLDAAHQRSESLRRSLEVQQEKLDAALAAERASRQEERERMLAQMSAAALAQAEESAQLRARTDAAAGEMARAHAGEIGRLSARAKAMAGEMARAHAGEIALLSARAKATAGEMARAHAGEIARLSARADAARREMASRHAEVIVRLSARANAAERAMAVVMASTSWRAAHAIAKIAGRLPLPFRIAGRRTLRAGWWAVTGQLPARLRHRWRARRWVRHLRNSALFDPAWYAATYPDVAMSGLDPTFHFAAYGAAEGRSSGPAFDEAWYRKRYPDVAAAGFHPLLHFLEHGALEGREWRAVAPASAPSAPDRPPEDAAALGTPSAVPPVTLDDGVDAAGDLVAWRPAPAESAEPLPAPPSADPPVTLDDGVDAAGDLVAWRPAPAESAEPLPAPPSRTRP